jgi:hypothetical protein
MCTDIPKANRLAGTDPWRHACRLNLALSSGMRHRVGVIFGKTYRFVVAADPI